MENFIGLISAYAGVCLLVFLFFAVLWFVVFLILRPLVIWYLKLNTIVTNQEIMNGYLSELVRQNEELKKELARYQRNNSSSSAHANEYERYMPK